MPPDGGYRSGALPPKLNPAFCHVETSIAEVRPRSTFRANRRIMQRLVVRFFIRRGFAPLAWGSLTPYHV